MKPTRFLNESNISNREAASAIIPQFDFYKLRLVERLELAWTQKDPQLSLLLTAQYEDENTFRVTIQFLGVRQLCLPEMHDRGWWLSEFEIEEISEDQLEGIRYKAMDHGDTDLQILCHEIRLVSCEAD